MSDVFAAYRTLQAWSEETVRCQTSIIIGVGALGSYLAEIQAAMGVGHLVLIDDDIVQPHNMLRMAMVTPEDIGRPKVQAVAAGLHRRFQGQTRVTPLQGNVQAMLGLGLVRRAGIVNLCADNRAARLHGSQMARLAGTPHLSGAIEGMTAFVSGIFAPPASGCYACTLTERERQAALPVRFSCAPGPEERAPSVPTTPLAASMAAGWMTQLFLRYAHGEREETLGMRTLINPPHNILQTARFQARTDCPCRSETLDMKPIVLSASRETITACNLLREAQSFCGEEAMIVLDYALVTEEVCPACGSRRELDAPRHEAVSARCADCGEPTRASAWTSFMDAAHPLAMRPLAELGLPSLHPIRVRAGERTLTFELAGDAASLGLTGREKAGC